MSTLKVNNLQVGQDGTAANNYTLYQPASPDGTVRLGYGVAGSVTDILTLKNSRLGIGTDNPVSTLHLQASSTGTIQTFTAPINGTQPNIIKFQLKDGTPDAEIKNESAKLIFATGSSATPRMAIDSLGNVGVGTDIPTMRLSVNEGGTQQIQYGASNSSGGYLGSTVASQFLLSGGAHYNTTNAWTAVATEAADINSYSGNIIFHTNTGLTNGSTFTPTERMRITSAGLLGIGTTPYVVLEATGTSGTYGDAVYNTVLAGTTYAHNNAASGAGILFSGIYNSNGDTTTYGFISARKENTNDGANGAFLTLGTRPAGTSTPTEAVRIDSAGKVGIGLTTLTAALEVQGQNAYASSANSLATSVSKSAFRVKGSNNASDSAWMGVETVNAYPYIQGANGNGSNALSLLLNPWGGNVGIATTSPNYKVDIDGEVGIKEGQPVTWHDGSGNASAQIFGDSSDNLIFRNGTAGHQKMIITSNGNTGIGIATPDSTLHIQSPSGSTTMNFTAPLNQPNKIQFRLSNGNLDAEIKNESARLIFSTGTSPSERMRIQNTTASVSSAGSGANGWGCVGIVDTNPTSNALALSIGGASGMYGIEDPRPLVYMRRGFGVGGGSNTEEVTLMVDTPASYNSSGVIYSIKSYAKQNLNGAHYAGHFVNYGSQYGANGSSAVYAETHKIDTNGGGDVVALHAKARLTHTIANNGGAVAGYFETEGGSNCPIGKPIVCLQGYTVNSYTNQILFRKHNGTNVVDVGSIKSNNSLTQFNTSSDYRLKENVVSLTGAIDRLKQLQPKRFNFIGDDETVDGFIAHEVTSVAPYAVSGEKDAVKKELVMDEDGNEQFDENGEIIDREVIDPQGVDYGKLSTLTIAALQEALAKIESLEARIVALES